MIVVVGRRRDPLAQSLLERWRGHDAALLTVRDLSRAGWRHDPSTPAAGQAVVGGRPVAVSDIAAVVTTLDGVTGFDLPHIVREDRDYVAGEMRAFLLVWLTTVPCPVLNRPSVQSLTGRGWFREQWRRVAGELRIPAVAVSEPTGTAEEPEIVTTVTLIGDVVLDAPTAVMADWVRTLAGAAGTTTLTAQFSGDDPPRLVSAGSLPDLTRPEIAAAALAWLQRGAP